MPGSAEMSVAEAHDGAVFVLIAGAIFINTRLVTAVFHHRDSVGVWTELHYSVRRASTGKGVPHAVSADNRIDVINIMYSGFDRICILFGRT